MKGVLFDLGKTLEDRDVLLPGARETLQAVQAMRDSNGEAAALALVSDFDTPDNPEQIPLIQQRYYKPRARDRTAGRWIGFLSWCR
jgi:hypothetical protein